ncbi:MAG TPA: methionine--tRNA ligase [Candidatus Margulisbacteria bacterium]|nr:MAG: methionine--tRNA ligase [Candidatus Margulisbacteria bacterium GWD2_39_127]OGI08211.1 MAG: methionine--tRNA ligase [Candidatus Margulisbacteria bacterium GWE2_39_32]HAR61924.1 methionine--tRNA ligase [Candidatus Margulisiibacteriota bacterium]HCT85082.1 methionine--tRNA ligase [Candidatus Margulisiibacteriota bacterium]
MSQKKYFTTPIYYVNDVPHIGHAYCTIVTDVLARYYRLLGYDVIFSTGTDEHGQKIQKTAEANGETPIELANRVVKRFEDLWTLLNISNDVFIRTTEKRHAHVVQELFYKIYQKNDIYLGEYEGWYCRPCETYLTETQLKEGKCPECNRPVEKLKEDSFFFRMSKYQDQLLAYIENNPHFVFPATRRNEVLNFIKDGLKDISISRTTMSWGIPVPEIPGLNLTKKHYIYVWFDALINYLTALGFEQDNSKVEEYWPEAVHILGKDIIKFHAVIWPTILLAADLQPPKQVIAHGFINLAGEKMSKSKGNVIDPYAVVNEYGVDPFRYFLMKEISFGLDGLFSFEALQQRYNSELANELGNLLNRTLSMVKKYFDASTPPFLEESLSKEGKELQSLAQELRFVVEAALTDYDFGLILEEIWKVIRRANKYIEEAAPWTLAKEGKTEKLGTVMYTLLETIRIIALYTAPFMPASSQKIWDQLEIKKDITKVTISEESNWGQINTGHQVGNALPIFPRRE